MVENEVKNSIRSEGFTKKFLADYQNYYSPFFVASEVEVENKITIDHVIYNQQNGKAIALIESKGGDIGITEFLRGIGQVTQYQQHIQQNKVLSYDDKCLTYLAFPDELFNSFDITKLAFPQSIKLLVLNSKNDSCMVLDPRANVRSEAVSPNLVRISPYYIRDNRLGELYVGLLELRKRSLAIPFGHRVNRNMDELATQVGFPNPGNARNIGISLSSLGLIDAFNRPTSIGFDFAEKSYGGFVTEILNDYLYPYVNTIFRALLDLSVERTNLVMTWSDLKENIKRIWGNKDVMFLTESENRYISSWMNILRDDVGAIDFTPNAQTKEVNIKYFPVKGTPSLLNTSHSVEGYIPLYVKRYLEANNLL